ncbi:exopolyphosphatase [Rhodovulum sp. DZ06]|uniref:Ppx/GppA phosphatase family protein n=1 Tax=Rhodovulum sp. DZ06 TaxID=3425126 RepID=UPI003D326FDE
MGQGMQGAATNGRKRARRVGVVDVGSNSVRMVVFEARRRAPDYFFNEKVLCGLGASLQETGRLSPDGRRRALAAIRRFAALAPRMGLDVLDGVATAALRDAEDGPAFRDLVEHETGLRLRVASGEDEARLAAQGVLLGFPGARGLVADLGGASLELSQIGEGRLLGPGRTFPLGPLRLQQLSDADVDAAIAEAFGSARDLVGPPGGRLYLVGGAWRAMTKIHMTRVDYPLDVLHGFSMPGPEMLRLARDISRADPEELMEEVSASSARLAVTPMGARVLAGLIRAAEPSEVLISAFGLREGVLWEHMDPAMREEDPLLSSARAMEARMSRRPGFGDALAEWVSPLFPGYDAAKLRIVRAVCLLADTAWSAHPDHRDVAVLEMVRRANLIGLSHRERSFAAAALSHRYRAARKLKGRAPDLGPLNEDDARDAKILGRAIRLGAMLTGSSPAVLSLAPLRVEGETLALDCAPEVQDIMGEVVRKRLGSLAQTMGLVAG